MTKEYVLRGTIEGMIKILQQDFNMPYDEAKFFIYSLMSYNSIEKNISKEELDLWYLADKSKYKAQTQLLNTHCVINFTTTIKSMHHLGYMFLVKYFFCRGIDAVLIGADLIYIVCTSIKKVKDTDYCVFARILELNIGNKGKLFSDKDIITANKDGKCDYQEEEWKCTYLEDNEDCTCNEEKKQLALAALDDLKIIKKVGDFWMLL